MGASRVYSRLTKTEPFAGYGGRIIPRELRHKAATDWASAVLPKAFVQSLDFSAGEWVASLPADTPEDVANDFEEGVLPEPPISEWLPFDVDHVGPEMSERIAASFQCSPADLVEVPKATLVLFAAQWIVDYLGSSPTAVALIREMHPRPQPDTIAWTSSMGVLYPVSGSSITRDEVADLMDLAADATSEFALLTSTDRLDPLVAQSITDTDLADVVSRADGVLLGAYDGEGHVRWRRRASCPTSG